MAITDSFGTSQDFIAQQQAKRLANEQAKAATTVANNQATNVAPNVNTQAGSTIPQQNPQTITQPTVINSNPTAAVPNISVGTQQPSKTTDTSLV